MLLRKNVYFFCHSLNVGSNREEEVKSNSRL